MWPNGDQIRPVNVERFQLHPVVYKSNAKRVIFLRFSLIFGNEGARFNLRVADFDRLSTAGFAGFPTIASLATVLEQT